MVPKESRIFKWFVKAFLKWQNGGGENGLTRKSFENVLSSQNIEFPFFKRETFGTFLPFSFLCFFFFFYALSLYWGWTQGFLKCLRRKQFQTFFQMGWKWLHQDLWNWGTCGKTIGGGCMYLRLHVLELVHLVLDPSNPLHRTFCLVHPVTNIPLERVVRVGELGRGGGSGSVAWTWGTVRIVWTTTLLIPRKATAVPSVPLCRHLSEASPHAWGGISTTRPHPGEAWMTKTVMSQATCHHSESESPTHCATCRVRKSSSTCETTSSSFKNTHKNNKHKQEYLAPYVLALR
jgi:hypothetical protein